jgi:hypothetical protein
VSFGSIARAAVGFAAGTIAALKPHPLALRNHRRWIVHPGSAPVLQFFPDRSVDASGAPDAFAAASMLLAVVQVWFTITNSGL